MAGYEVFGGPCHWDIHFHFIVALGPGLMKEKGYVDDDGNLTLEGQANAGPLKKGFARRLKKAFDDFFNPTGPAGKLYTFPPERPCCNYHLDADFDAGDSSTDNLDEKQARAAMRAKPGSTIIQLEKMGITDHPHADIGGQVIQLPNIEMDNQGLKSLPHEIGHILGLPDRYRTKYNHVTEEEEHEHQGQLMGKPLSNGQREITSQEAGEIAANAGLTCNFDRCCERQAHPLHGQHPPATGGEMKSMQFEYCGSGFVLSDPHAYAEIDDGVPLTEGE